LQLRHAQQPEVPQPPPEKVPPENPVGREQLKDESFLVTSTEPQWGQTAFVLAADTLRMENSLRQALHIYS
jgi:hypothetical protein